MGSIPLPALHVNPPQQQDPMAGMEKLVQLKSLMQGQQMQQQEMQIRGQQVKDQQATTAAMKAIDPSKYQSDPSAYYADVSKSVLDNGGSATAAQGVQQHGLTVLKTVSDMHAQDAATGSKNLETFIAKQKALGDGLAEAKDIPDEQLQAWTLARIKTFADGGVLDPQSAQHLAQGVQQATDPKALRAQIQVTANSALGAKAIADQKKTEAETAKSQSEADLGQNKLEIIRNYKNNPQLLNSQVDAAAPPDKYGSLNVRTKAMVNQAMSVGDVDAAKEAIKQASEQVGGIEKDVAEKTNPAVQAAELHLATAKKAAEQAITDGDPRAAAQLLVDGTVAPSQLVSSRKPAFAQQAFTAAAQMQPGWSATKADADYKVASSPANVAFFGSAKSLTDKGGTLDQLADAAKDIPHDKIPVFNTVADALKASTGSGPIAKYASIALGVADDYSKVMGGGQGSDTSRNQALSLVTAKQSPEQRAASIEGIRGSVGSQLNSRIGNNTVLHKMYGGQGSAATKTYQGHTYSQQSDGSWKLQQ